MTSGQTIRLDASNTRISFAVRWLGFITVRGYFTQVEGDIRIPDGAVEQAEIAVDVLATSVRTGIALRDRHLRGPRFLDSGRHPRISFRGRRVERLNGLLIIDGTLLLRGLERDVRMSCPIDANGGGGDHRAGTVMANGDTADGAGANPLAVRLGGQMVVTRTPHGIGVAHGIHRLNPLLYAIGSDVTIRAQVLVPARELLPVLLPVLGP